MSAKNGFVAAAFGLPAGYRLLAPAGRAEFDNATRRLLAALVDEGVTYGGTAIPALPAALLVDAWRWQALAEDIPVLWKALERAARAGWEDAAASRPWALTTAERRLLGAPVGGRTLAPLMRLDTVPTAHGLQVIEVNTLFSGLGSSDGLARCLAGDPAFAGVLRESDAALMPAARSLARLLLGKRHAADTTVLLAGRPAEDPIADEYHYTLRQLTEWGIEHARCAAIQAIETRDDGGLAVGGHPVDAVYLRGSYADWLGTAASSSLDRAWREGRAEVVGPLAGLLVDSKAALAALGKDAIDMVAETVSLATATSAFRRRLLADREDWVIKPADGFGGNGVAIGASLSASDWRRICGIAGSRHVAQRFVVQPQVTAGGRTWFLNLNLIVFDGVLAGGFARVSNNPLVSIARSGAMLPLFIAQPSRTPPPYHECPATAISQRI